MKYSFGHSAREGAPSAAIKQAAAEWISRRDAGILAAEELEFHAWYSADPRHAAAFDALQPAWSELNRPRHAGRAGDLRRQVARVVARRRRRRRGVAATGFAMAAVLAVAFVLFRPATEIERLAPTVAVRPDRQQLPDGSRVDLNAGARLIVEFTADTRRVQLVSGEALFHVARDTSRPFIVSAGRVAVRAVGTAFAVRIEPHAVDVLVTEGQVAVEQAPLAPSRSPTSAAAEYAPDAEPRGAAPVLVSAGRRVTVPVNHEVSVVPQPISSSEMASALAWRSRRVEFNGTPLADAVELFNRDNAVQLAVANSETGAIQITGVFWTNDPEAFSRAVEFSVGVKTARAPDGRIVLQK